MHSTRPSPQVGDVELPRLVQRQRHRQLEPLQHLHQRQAAEVEDLHPVVAGVGDIQRAARRRDRQPRGRIEARRIAARSTQARHRADGAEAALDPRHHAPRGIGEEHGAAGIDGHAALRLRVGERPQRRGQLAL
nr:hypothetical protein [Mitsuaria sp. TWR114]